MIVSRQIDSSRHRQPSTDLPYLVSASNYTKWRTATVREHPIACSLDNDVALGNRRKGGGVRHTGKVHQKVRRAGRLADSFEHPEAGLGMYTKPD